MKGLFSLCISELCLEVIFCKVSLAEREQGRAQIAEGGELDP